MDAIIPIGKDFYYTKGYEQIDLQGPMTYAEDYGYKPAAFNKINEILFEENIVNINNALNQLCQMESLISAGRYLSTLKETITMPLTTSSSLPGHIGKWFASDYNFHHLYPLYIQALAQRHWTPLRVVASASKFLAADQGVKILDIGSGPGKFCLGGAYYNPGSFFYGIEQRHDLIQYAIIAREMIGLNNVTFMHGNVMEIDFTQYDHFYFFNSFYENLPGTYKIDDKFTYSRALYNQYHGYLYRQLEKMPAGTKLVTYHCSEKEAPDGYHIVGTDIDHLLKFWVKV